MYNKKHRKAGVWSMVISSKGRYGLRVMVELALSPSGVYQPLHEIAVRQDISKKYLESIVRSLIKGGLVQGASGKGGGYRLARPVETYTLGEILNCVEESLALVQCMNVDCTCTKTADCYTYPIWASLQEFHNLYFQSFTLLDVIQREPSQGKMLEILAQFGKNFPESEDGV